MTLPAPRTVTKDAGWSKGYIAPHVENKSRESRLSVAVKAVSDYGTGRLEMRSMPETPASNSL